MKNKILITCILMNSINMAYADYTAKFFVEGISIKNVSTPAPTPPSTNCIYDSNNNRMGIKNISENTSPYGIGIGESAIYYNTGFIGRDTATQNFPAGLTLGDYVESLVGYDLHKICADDFSIYPDLDNPPAPSYTYNDFSIPNGSIALSQDSGNDIYGFLDSYNPLISYGNPITINGVGRIMLQIDGNYFGNKAVFLTIVKNQEKMNEQMVDAGNVLNWINNYDKIILSNNDESFKIEIDISSTSSFSNFVNEGIFNLSSMQYNQIVANPNIITKIKFRNKQ